MGNTTTIEPEIGIFYSLYKPRDDDGEDGLAFTERTDE